MNKPATVMTQSDQNDSLAQAYALLANLRTKADAEAPTLTEDLAQLETLMAEGIAAAVKETLEENAAFTSIMAHELRIPMTSIRGYIDMLAKGHTGPLNEMQKQFAGVIRSNALRMEHLVSAVNDLTKIRAGRLKLEVRMEMYKNLIMGVEKETAALAKEKGHTVTFDTPQGMPLLNTDHARMKQALVNLVDNALRYTPPGTGQVTVVGAKLEDGNAQVTISDNGIGMSTEDLTHLGEAFWRGDDDLVREHKGHGLGFALAQRLVELLGGTVLVKSTPGTGTTVSVTIPGLS